MRTIAGCLLSYSFAFAVVALGGTAAVAEQAAPATEPAPAAASTNAPVVVNIRFKNDTTYSGNATVAYPKSGSVSPSEEAKSVQFVNGKPPSGSYGLVLNGPGKLGYSNGSTLSGDFVNGVINGQGEYAKPGAFDYKGAFTNGQPTNGTVTFANGAKYVGSFADGRPAGQGTLTAATPPGETTGQWSKGVLSSGYEVLGDGSRFEGNFDGDGKPDGSGTYRSAAGTTLSGTWQHGLYAGSIVERDRSGTVLTVDVAPPESSLHGAATIAFSNGDRATGTLTPDGVLEGPGTYSFHNGVQIRGTFGNGRLSGPATLTTAGGHTYTGKIEGGVFIGPHDRNFENRATYRGPADADGRPNGSGTYRFAGGETLSGTWIHGRMSGPMVDRFPDGTTFNVKVKPAADVLRGPATITFANGDRASGILRNGTLNGAGTYVFAGNGNRIDGIYEKGRLQGPASLTMPDGQRYVGTMADDGTVQ